MQKNTQQQNIIRSIADGLWHEIVKQVPASKSHVIDIEGKKSSSC